MNFNTSFSNTKSDILINLSQWQYWWWFWFVFLWSFYFFMILRVSRFRTLKFQPKMVTSMRPHGKWGDLIVCLIPAFWCLNILINSNIMVRMSEWQHDSTLFTLRIRGKQWYWIYKFDTKDITQIFTATKNVGHNKWIFSSHGALENTDDYLHALQLRYLNVWYKKYWKLVNDLYAKEEYDNIASSTEPVLNKGSWIYLSHENKLNSKFNLKKNYTPTFGVNNPYISFFNKKSFEKKMGFFTKFDNVLHEIGDWNTSPSPIISKRKLFNFLYFKTKEASETYKYNLNFSVKNLLLHIQDVENFTYNTLFADKIYKKIYENYMFNVKKVLQEFIPFFSKFVDDGFTAQCVSCKTPTNFELFKKNYSFSYDFKKVSKFVDIYENLQNSLFKEYLLAIFERRGANLSLNTNRLLYYTLGDDVPFVDAHTKFYKSQHQFKPASLGLMYANIKQNYNHPNFSVGRKTSLENAFKQFSNSRNYNFYKNAVYNVLYFGPANYLKSSSNLKKYLKLLVFDKVNDFKNRSIMDLPLNYFDYLIQDATTMKTFAIFGFINRRPIVDDIFSAFSVFKANSNFFKHYFLALGKFDKAETIIAKRDFANFKNLFKNYGINVDVDFVTLNSRRKRFSAYWDSRIEEVSSSVLRNARNKNFNQSLVNQFNKDLDLYTNGPSLRSTFKSTFRRPQQVISSEFFSDLFSTANTNRSVKISDLIDYFRSDNGIPKNIKADLFFSLNSSQPKKLNSNPLSNSYIKFLVPDKKNLQHFSIIDQLSTNKTNLSSFVERAEALKKKNRIPFFVNNEQANSYTWASIPREDSFKLIKHLFEWSRFDYPFISVNHNLPEQILDFMQTDKTFKNIPEELLTDINLKSDSLKKKDFFIQKLWEKVVIALNERTFIRNAIISPGHFNFLTIISDSIKKISDKNLDSLFWKKKNRGIEELLFLNPRRFDSIRVFKNRSIRNLGRGFYYDLNTHISPKELKDHVEWSSLDSADIIKNSKKIWRFSPQVFYAKMLEIINERFLDALPFENKRELVNWSSMKVATHPEHLVKIFCDLDSSERFFKPLRSKCDPCVNDYISAALAKNDLMVHVAKQIVRRTRQIEKDCDVLGIASRKYFLSLKEFRQKKVALEAKYPDYTKFFKFSVFAKKGGFSDMLTEAFRPARSSSMIRGQIRRFLNRESLITNLEQVETQYFKSFHPFLIYKEVVMDNSAPGMIERNSFSHRMVSHWAHVMNYTKLLIKDLDNDVRNVSTPQMVQHLASKEKIFNDFYRNHKLLSLTKSQNQIFDMLTIVDKMLETKYAHGVCTETMLNLNSWEKYKIDTLRYQPMLKHLPKKPAVPTFKVDEVNPGNLNFLSTLTEESWRGKLQQISFTEDNFFEKAFSSVRFLTNYFKNSYNYLLTDFFYNTEPTEWHAHAHSSFRFNFLNRIKFEKYNNLFSFRDYSYSVSLFNTLFKNRFTQNTISLSKGSIGCSSDSLLKFSDSLLKSQESKKITELSYMVPFKRQMSFEEGARWVKRGFGSSEPIRIIKFDIEKNPEFLFKMRYFTEENLEVKNVGTSSPYYVMKQKRYAVRKSIVPKKFYNNIKTVYDDDKFDDLPKISSFFWIGNNLPRETIYESVQELKELYNLVAKNKKRSDTFNIATTRRLVRTRHTLVLPSHTNISVITNSFDVVHSWFIPGLGIKFDCIPGRSTHHTFFIDSAGFYYGQCAEICGRYHHHMPIRVCVLPFDQFLVWWHHFGLPKLTYNGATKNKIRNTTITFRKYAW